MLATSLPVSLLPILACWFVGAGTIAALCLTHRSRIRRHDRPV